MIKYHIILSTIALLVMLLAGIQAVLLIIQDYILRHSHSRQNKLIKFINYIFIVPIETLEKYLFNTLWLEFILLILVFISSLIFFGNIFMSAMREKSILTLAALSIIALLLWGRHQRGWRGGIAIRWTFLGMILLLIIYCGTGLLLHAPY
jgi:ABC-type uncharacterized transport system permease subunit